MNDVLIKKNTQVPASATKKYRTSAETTADTQIHIDITQGDTPDLELAEVLGRCTLSGFPQDDPPNQPVDVTMRFDENCRLHFSAKYLNTGQKIETSLDIPGGLKPEEVEKHRKHLKEIGFLREADAEH